MKYLIELHENIFNFVDNLCCFALIRFIFDGCVFQFTVDQLNQQIIRLNLKKSTNNWLDSF